ncbi:cell division protein DedD [Streptomyces sp. NPDC047967]|uniref:cell division protein DedD n=1 Tax=Streptomyces sp. NPDC047967 TaxID=3154924 RepID=UPI0033F23D02
MPVPASRDGRRPRTDDWALGVAAAVSGMADCSRTQVGAVLLDRHKNLCAGGYNGPPRGQPGCREEAWCPRGRLDSSKTPGRSDHADCTALQATERLLIRARRADLEGGTVYVTRAPGYRCLQRLREARVFRVVWTNETGTEATVLEWAAKPRAGAGVA